jgi:hypothetical protein
MVQDTGVRTLAARRARAGAPTLRWSPLRAEPRRRAVGSESWHELYEKLSPTTQDLHRALRSVIEEFDAVDWYQQRVDVTPDPELKAILAHNGTRRRSTPR